MSESIPSQDTLSQSGADFRTHADIVRASGASALRDLLAEKGFESLTSNRVQQWANRDSIPGDYWNAIAELELATLEELAAHADPRRLTETKAA